MQRFLSPRVASMVLEELDNHYTVMKNTSMSKYNNKQHSA